MMEILHYKSGFDERWPTRRRRGCPKLKLLSHILFLPFWMMEILPDNLIIDDRWPTRRRSGCPKLKLQSRKRWRRRERRTRVRGKSWLLCNISDDSLMSDMITRISVMSEIITLISTQISVIRDIVTQILCIVSLVSDFSSRLFPRYIFCNQEEDGGGGGKLIALWSFLGGQKSVSLL